MSQSPLQQRFASGRPLFSIEFFPPKSEDAAEQLLRTAERLRRFRPDFVSITYGAGGSTRERTLSYARRLNEEFDYEVMPHLTCVGHSREELRGIIECIRTAGLRQIMALRGDPPRGETNFTPHPDGLRYANELVELIRSDYPDCAIGVAGYPEKHPEAASPEVDLGNLKRKVDAGADFITTQLFLDNAHYFKFVHDCQRAGIVVPILPGLMCVTSPQQARRFCEMCGTRIPAELDEALNAAGDDKDRIESVGVDWAFEQAKELLERGAPGIHLYILNRAGPASRLVERLRSAGFYH